MDSFLLETVYFGIVISLLSYWIAVQIRKLLPYPIFNPLLISAVISIGILIIFDIDFDIVGRTNKNLAKLYRRKLVALLPDR